MNGSMSFLGNNEYKLNHAQKGGAISSFDASSPVILDSSFIANTADDKGAAIYHASKEVDSLTIVRASRFDRNKAKSLKVLYIAGLTKKSQ